MNTVFSPDRIYRYTLWRTWDGGSGHVAFIGLNPSTADETTDDNTVRRCIKFGRSWGYSGMCMLNLFGLRSTDPSVLHTSADPVGPDNDLWVRRVTDAANLIVCAWGNGGKLHGQGNRMRRLLADKTLHCLIVNLSGEPKHPLYARGDLRPQACPPPKPES